MTLQSLEVGMAVGIGTIATLHLMGRSSARKILGAQRSSTMIVNDTGSATR